MSGGRVRAGQVPGFTRPAAANHVPMEPLLDFKAAGRFLGVSARTIARLVKTGQIVTVRASLRSRRIRPSELREYVHRQTSG